jgi:hypothetical protein
MMSQTDNYFMNNILTGILTSAEPFSARTPEEKDNFISFMLDNWPDAKVIQLSEFLGQERTDDLVQLRINIKTHYMSLLNLPIATQRRVYAPTIRRRRPTTPLVGRAYRVRRNLMEEFNLEDGEEVEDEDEDEVAEATNYSNPIVKHDITNSLPIEVCCICIEKNVNSIIPCQHSFCFDCISTYSSKPNNGCPICRSTFNCITRHLYEEFVFN